MIDKRKLNSVILNHNGKVCHICGIIGSGKRSERVVLEENIKPIDIDYLMRYWSEKVGYRWIAINTIVKSIKDNGRTFSYDTCPNCGCDNERLIENIFDGKVKPLYYTFHMDYYVESGDGYMTIRCSRCKTIYNYDIST